MLTRRSFIAASVALPVAGEAGCSLLKDPYTFYFKFVLAVTIDGARHLGSTIIKATWRDTFGFGEGERWRPRLTGDAILIELGSSRSLIGLLGSVGNQPSSFSITNGLIHGLGKGLPDSQPRKEDGSGMFDKLKHFRGSYELPRADWPVLAYFPNLQEIKSSRIVYPRAEIGGALNLVVDSFTVELSRGPASAGLVDKLPWYDLLGTFPPVPATEQEKMPAYQKIMPFNINVNGDYR